jgi:hypothetical protein
MNGSTDYGLEFLLAFDGRVHNLAGGYWLKFVIRRVGSAPGRSHGLTYSLTLHGPNGNRLIGFDNAHRAPRRRGDPTNEMDHVHRTEHDPGRPYAFVDGETLIADFFREVERVLAERGIGMEVISFEDENE